MFLKHNYSVKNNKLLNLLVGHVGTLISVQISMLYK